MIAVMGVTVELEDIEAKSGLTQKASYAYNTGTTSYTITGLKEGTRTT
jgi:hypothetical protein